MVELDTYVEHLSIVISMQYSSAWSGFVIDSVEKRAKEVFVASRGEEKAKYAVKTCTTGIKNTVRIPLDTTTEEAKEIYTLVKKDFDNENSRRGNIQNALNGIDRAKNELEQVQKILEGQEL